MPTRKMLRQVTVVGFPLPCGGILKMDFCQRNGVSRMEDSDYKLKEGKVGPGATLRIHSKTHEATTAGGAYGRPRLFLKSWPRHVGSR